MKALCWHGKQRRARRARARPEDPQPARRDRQDHLHRDLRLRPAPLRRLHPDDEDAATSSATSSWARSSRSAAASRTSRSATASSCPFTIACGNCFFCQNGAVVGCATTPTRTPGWPRSCTGYSPAGLFGYSHMTGRLRRRAGRVRARAVRRRRPAQGARRTCTDEQVLFLSDIFPTGYMAAENCDIEPGDTVAVWGCGPVGQFAIRARACSAPERVIAIDRVPDRLDDGARRRARPRRSTSKSATSTRRCKEMTGGRGPDALHRRRRHGGARHRRSTTCYDKVKTATDAGDRSPARAAPGDHVCRKGGTVSIPGVYGGFLDKFPLGAAFEQGPDAQDGPDPRAPLPAEPLLRPHRAAARSTRRFVITHRCRSTTRRRATRRSATSRTAASRS